MAKFAASSSRAVCAVGSMLLLLCAISLANARAPTEEYVDARYDWSSVDKVLEDAVQDRAFPGCVAIIGNKDGYLYSKAFGDFTYGAIPPENSNNPKMKIDTLFDMASVTKVSATLSAVAQFYQRGELPLHTRVETILGPEYSQNGKGPITILNCLLHDAGYPADPIPNYWAPSFGCPETSKEHPLENFSCQTRIYRDLLAQKLINPIGSKYIYSDLSFITLMYVVGQLAKDFKYVSENELYPGCNQGGPEVSQCYFEAYVRKYVFEHIGMKDSSFLPHKSEWHRAAPAEDDKVYLRKVIQGQVSDGNAYALGGIAGHAGLFSNAPDMFTLMHLWLFPPTKAPVLFLNSTTTTLFIKEYNHSQSSRALGWNTNDPTVYDQGWNCSCGTLSSKTFLHTGYTGTQVCADPTRNIITVLLTNRVYPTAANNKIRVVRQLFNSAAQRVTDSALSAEERSRLEAFADCQYLSKETR